MMNQGDYCRKICHFFFSFLFYKLVERVGGGSVINGATLCSLRTNREIKTIVSVLSFLLMHCKFKARQSFPSRLELNLLVACPVITACIRSGGSQPHFMAAIKAPSRPKP